MLQNWWKSWSHEYLQYIQARHSWLKSADSAKVGDLVLIKNEILPPSKWPLGKITEIFKGSDGLVRVVTVKTATSQFTRPNQKLIALNFNHVSDE